MCLIGWSCKCSNILRWPVLIGRGLNQEKLGRRDCTGICILYIFQCALSTMEWEWSSEKEIKEEISKVEDAFRNATGKELKYIRPTYGNANSKVRAVTDRPIINWCVDSLDWKSRNADKGIEEIKKTKNIDGRIILMHVIYDSTLEAVDRLIPDLIKDGYQIVTVSELAEYKGFTLEEGKIYYQFIK